MQGRLKEKQWIASWLVVGLSDFRLCEIVNEVCVELHVQPVIVCLGFSGLELMMSSDKIVET